MMRAAIFRIVFLTLLVSHLAVAAGAQTGIDVTRPLLGMRTDDRLLALDDVPQFTVPSDRVDKLIAEEPRWLSLGMSARYAAPIDVEISPGTHGVWESIGDGRRLWRIRISSPGARSLNLGFSHFDLPPGARLHVFSLGDGTEIGPFDRSDRDVHGELWLPPLASDELLVAVVVPAIRQHRVDLTLGVINHGYAGFGEAAPKSGGCNVDLGCAPADGWQEHARAVGLISVAGSHYCSAFLVNNTAEDRRPLLLTARHCGVHAGNAASVVVLWNHDEGGCRDADSVARDDDAGRVQAQKNGQRRFQTGARWLADDPVTDFSLLELDDPIDPTLGLYFAGWDRRDREPRSSVVIHHPNTDSKRISFDADPAAVTSHLDADSGGNGSHLRVSWELGTTEGGSSGAPLFNERGQVVGLLHGGLASCGNREPDWFGRLAAAWEGGGSASARLRDWLDPLGTGVEDLGGRSDRPPE